MKLDKENILHLADLAKLKLTEEEIATYGKQLQDVLSYVEKINTLDLEKIKESLSGAEEMDTPPRPDSDSKSEPGTIDQAGDLQSGYVSAPNVFEK